MSAKAFMEWRTLLGPEMVVELGASAKYYTSIGRIAPATEGEVVKVLTIARKYHIPLYPISTGKNWGYGGRTPTKKGSVILDLSRMNRIVSYDAELGLVGVEPGVTFGDLQDFLLTKNAPFVSPVIGAGLSPSLIGNALEKGRSGVAYIDRFSTLISLRVILADGSLYESPSRFFKWGVGPYVDGLFGQSNFGIVVQATFSLSTKSAYTCGFYISVKNDGLLSMAVDRMRDSQNNLGSIFPSVSIQNAERVISRNWPLGDNPKVSDWSITGILQGELDIVRVAQKVIKEKFDPVAENIIFFTEKKLDRFVAISHFLPFVKRIKIMRQMEPLLRSVIESAEGRGRGVLFLDSKKVDYAGLLFVSVVLPASGEKVSKFVSGARELCDQYGTAFEVILLNFTPPSLLFSFLIIFNPNYLFEKEKAYRYYREFSTLAEKHGGFVYRGSANAMDVVVNHKSGFWKVAKKIKIALDPEDIISPGRYM